MNKQDLKEMEEADCLFFEREPGVIYSVAIDEEAFTYVSVTDGIRYVAEYLDPEWYWGGEWEE